MVDQSMMAIIFITEKNETILTITELVRRSCENTRYSLVTNIERSTSIQYQSILEIGKRKSHNGCASLSGPQGFEYQSGTSGGSLEKARIIRSRERQYTNKTITVSIMTILLLYRIRR